jgi:hypothetical protein
LVSAEKIAAIEKAMDENPGSVNSALKELLGDAFSYGDIRAVQYHREKKEKS